MASKFHVPKLGRGGGGGVWYSLSAIDPIPVYTSCTYILMYTSCAYLTSLT